MSVLLDAIIVIILLLIAGILLIPFRLSLSLFKDGTYFEGFYKISYLGFALMKGVIPEQQPVTIKVTDGMQETQPETSDLKEAEESDKEEFDKRYHRETDKGPDTDSVFSATNIRLAIDAFPQIAYILIDFIKSINMKKLFCQISFGMDDPVDTAMISGYLWSIAFALGLYRADIFIEPRFEGEQFDGSFIAELEAKVLWAVVAAAKALKEERTRKLIIELVKGEMA